MIWVGWVGGAGLEVKAAGLLDDRGFTWGCWWRKSLGLCALCFLCCAWACCSRNVEVEGWTFSRSAWVRLWGRSCASLGSRSSLVLARAAKGSCQRAAAHDAPKEHRQYEPEPAAEVQRQSRSDGLRLVRSCSRRKSNWEVPQQERRHVGLCIRRGQDATRRRMLIAKFDDGAMKLRLYLSHCQYPPVPCREMRTAAACSAGVQFWLSMSISPLVQLLLIIKSAAI